MQKTLLTKTQDQVQAVKLLCGKPRNVLLYGGSRSGKTFIMVYAIMVRALKAPGSRHIILRYRSNSVRRSIRMDTLEKVCKLAFPKLKFHESVTDGMIRLPNKSEIWFGGLDTEDRAERILGREFSTIYFNECSEIDFDSVNTALTRLAQKTSLVNKAYFDCNPAGKSHWTYRWFVEKVDPISRQKLINSDNYASMLMNPAGNEANLPAGYLENTLECLSERQKERFLLGRWLDDQSGALWKSDSISRNRVHIAPTLSHVVLGIDPAVTGKASSDLTGILVAGRGSDGHYYVLEDASMRGTAQEWGSVAIRLYWQYECDRIIGEVNNGGDLIEHLLRSLEPDVSYRAVRASRGKIARAEPIAALYERNKVHHVGVFSDLEDEMCSYDGNAGCKSPDRMDALVWALSALGDCNGQARFICA